MIVLPKGAFIVLQDEAPKKEVEERASLIYSMEDINKAPVKPNSGLITFTSEELNEFQLCKVIFRENIFRYPTNCWIVYSNFNKNITPFLFL